MSRPIDHPSDLTLCIALALSLWTTAVSSAPSVANEAVEAYPGTARGFELLLAGDAQAAAELFGTRVALDPGDDRAAEGRVRALLGSDLWIAALDEARSFHEALPTSAGVRAALGEALLRGGRPDEALAVLEPLQTGPASSARGLRTLSRIRLARGQTAEAAKLIERALELDPGDRKIWRSAAELAPTRALAVERLERYLALSEGDDPDRIEAAEDSLRIWRKLGERPVWVRHGKPERLELPLRLVRNEAGWLIGYSIEARVGPKAKRVRLLLDTGSTGLFLVKRMARKGGFEPLAGETVFGGGGARRHESSRGLLPEFALGQLRFSDAMVSTTGYEFDPRGRFHGVLGIFVFDGYRVTIDLQRGRLLLEPAEQDFDGSDYWMFLGQMLVRAAAQGGPDGLFLFDTGASASVISSAYLSSLEQARLVGDANLRAFGGRVEGAKTVHGVRLAFGGLSGRNEALHAVDLSLPSHLAEVEISGYLGLDVLEGATLEIDTDSRRLRVTRSDP